MEERLQSSGQRKNIIIKLSPEFNQPLTEFSAELKYEEIN